MAAQFTNGQISYEKVINNDIELMTALKILPTEGNLVYEYNPFRNYRLTEPGYIYKNRLYTPRELLIELRVIQEDDLRTNEECLQLIELYLSWKDLVGTIEEDPTLVEAGELTDFETGELNFDINHPVEVLPLYSYDNSVNLIINDGKNKPRLINSRFSATSRNKYLIVDRKGNNDTNIYDLGSLFEIDTSLYKRVIEIPKLRLVGVNEGGRMAVGNYHFYFRYADADGNETDFVAESGLVSLFVGNTPSSIRSGFREEDSHKLVRLLLSNIDSAYQYVCVYYTKSTSDILLNAEVSAFKINQKFLVNNMLNCDITITGYEDVTLIDVSEINPMYQIADSVETQALCQNMLFLGNIQKPEIPYLELSDLSLRFLPRIQEEVYPLTIDHDYNVSSTSFGYYDPKFIYNKVGYWNHELYRIGIVYIMSDNSLSPVFNVRGIENLNSGTKYSNIPMWRDVGGIKTRNYIVSDEETYKIITEDISYGSSSSGRSEEDSSGADLENSKGVIAINIPSTDSQLIYSINFDVAYEVLTYLRLDLNIKGFFFVRQKRIPTILCLAYTIGLDKESNTPILPVSESKYISERFLTDDRILDNGFEDRLYTFDNSAKVRTEAAICPEYDVDSAYLNTLFSGDSFTITESDVLPGNQYLSNSERNYYTEGFTKGNPNNIYNVKIIGVEDNVKLVAINDNLFSARAGEAEEAFRYEYLEKENKVTEASNLLRGSYGPYLGITGYSYSGKTIDIKIPGFSSMTQEDLFKIRYADKAPFYAISERIDLRHMEDWFDLSEIVNSGDTSETEISLLSSLYRGDCYICQFTHRLNRNFQDPSAPINDKIVDPNCWKDNYEIADNVLKTENFEDINLGDVNAIKLGMWVTITVRSTKNLNIRGIDDSDTDETALTGHPRGFYPYHPISGEGAYKTPEALCYNKGFEKSLSERYNFEVPDVPAIKNDFTNRIAYSDIHVNDAFKNGFRVFLGTSYRDYPKTYGSITKIVELRGNLLCVFEHGVALIPVNERAVAGEGAGGNVYINTSNVLPENPKVLSDTFGSQWRDSVIKTPRAVYGVDTIGKKIWRTNGESFECISDFKIQEFLNQNISLTERELEPVIGIRNVKSHFNRFKNDVMFTFYDNLYGFEERAWNLCFNEDLQKWITFYSWMPSYSENIYNLYFSFDRNTSKWITKLGVSHSDNSFSDGVVLSNNTIPNDAKAGDRIGELKLANRTLPEGEGISVDIEYELVRDNYRNIDNFKMDIEEYLDEYGKTKKRYYLALKVDASELCSELYVRGSNLEITTLETIRAKKGQWEKLPDKYRVYEDNNHTLYTDYDFRVHRCKKNEKDSSLEVTLNFYTWLNNCVLNSNYPIYKDDRGRRINIDKDRRLNGNKVVLLLNIKANIKATYSGDNVTLGEAYVSGFTNKTVVDAGYYESVVAVIPLYNLQFLTTDFWKHGLAGIIDIADKIYPTYWYGKQHPFEFEFVVADNPSAHKIFDNLQIISNNAEPESFHYEIVGDCYNFAKDKKNMYIRLEATKELYQYNGCDVTYDHEYSDLDSIHRPLLDSDGNEIPGFYDRSTLMPLYYSRQDTINEIEDSYHLKDDVPTKDFSALAGGEIVHYKTLDEYRIWNHAKAVDMLTKGRLRGNMQYNEDQWLVQINPINIVYKNEKDWTDINLDLITEYRSDGTVKNSRDLSDKIPIELGLSPIPDQVLEKGDIIYDWNNPTKSDIPENSLDRAIVSWGNLETKNEEVKLKDKWIKIRIRYTGNKLAIITAIRTLYSVSYS